MKEKESSEETLMLIGLGAAVGGLVGIAIGMGVLSYIYPIFQTDKWAAWVQAVGSVIAILVSALLVIWQLSEQRKQKNKADFEEAVSVVINLLDAIDALDDLASSFINNQKEEPKVNDLTNYRQTFMIWYDGLEQINPFKGIVSKIAPTILALRSDALGLANISEKFEVGNRLCEECVNAIDIHKGFLENKRLVIKSLIDDFVLNVQVNLRGFPEGVSVTKAGEALSLIDKES